MLPDGCTHTQRGLTSKPYCKSDMHPNLRFGGGGAAAWKNFLSSKEVISSVALPSGNTSRLTQAKRSTSMAALSSHDCHTRTRTSSPPSAPDCERGSVLAVCETFLHSLAQCFNASSHLLSCVFLGKPLKRAL